MWVISVEMIAMKNTQKAIKHIDNEHSIWKEEIRVQMAHSVGSNNSNESVTPAATIFFFLSFFLSLFLSCLFYAYICSHAQQSSTD